MIHGWVESGSAPLEHTPETNINLYVNCIGIKTKEK